MVLRNQQNRHEKCPWYVLLSHQSQQMNSQIEGLYEILIEQYCGVTCISSVTLERICCMIRESIDV